MKIEKNGTEEERVRIPKDNEVFGVVESKLGGKRFSVRCQDGFVRICRIPGRLSRDLWISVGDVVIVVPWEIQSKERGDIVWSYKKSQVEFLRRKNILKV
mgnify:CR=1 FL=1